MKIKLTQSGVELLLRALDISDNDTKPILNGMIVGNGVRSETDTEEKIMNPLLRLGINDFSRTDDYIELTSVFNNISVEDRFKVTEIGITAKDPNDAENDILFAYGYVTEAEAAVIPSATDYTFETSFTVNVYVGSLENIEVFLEEKMAGVSKSDFEAHIKDYHNPHKVTKESVGLGNVENKLLVDMTPLYEIPNILQPASPGERVAIFFGKVARGLQDFINHLKDKNNPHNVTCTTVGAAPKDHSHSTNDIKTGVLGIERGGTGVDNITKLKALLGFRNVVIEFGEYKGSGKSGAAYPNKLQFNKKKPMLVFVSGGTSNQKDWDCCTIILGYGSTQERGGFTATDGYGLSLNMTWGEDFVSWYAIGEESTQRYMSQKSEKDVTYYYTAICLVEEEE